jgi:hypothetical protein
MPNDQGVLSESEKRDIIDKINKLWTGSQKNCPICGSNNWIIGDHVVSSQIVTAGAGIMIGGPAYPAVLLISQPCGYTLQFNAVILGVLKSEGPKS